MTLLRVRTVFTGPAGSPWLSTAYFAGSDQILADAAVTAVGTFWGAIDARLDNQVLWATEPDVVRINEVDGSPTGIFATTVQSGFGAVGGDMAPTLINALVRFRTGSFVDGREVRGRWFIPGLSETDLSDGVLAAAAVTAFQAAATNLINNPPNSLQIWQRPRLADPLADPPIEARDGSQHTVLTAQAINRFSPLRSRRD